MCVQSRINDYGFMKIPGRERIHTESSKNFSNTNDYGRSALNRTHALSNDVRLKFNPNLGN